MYGFPMKLLNINIFCKTIYNINVLKGSPQLLTCLLRISCVHNLFEGQSIRIVEYCIHPKLETEQEKFLCLM